MLAVLEVLLEGHIVGFIHGSMLEVYQWNGITNYSWEAVLEAVPEAVLEAVLELPKATAYA